MIYRLILFTVILFFPLIAHAGSTDTTSVNIEVQAINEISVNNGSVSLSVSSAVAGAQPISSTTTASYNITTNCTANSKKITGTINSDMPSGVTLDVDVTAPSGVLSSGYVTMSSAPSDAVTGIDAAATPNLQISFRMTAVVAAGIVTTATRTLTLTLTDAI